MRFQAGPGLYKYKLTARASQEMVVPSAGGVATTVHVKPLRAVFEWGNGHIFDSVKAQERYGWTDEEREMVEKALLDPNRNHYLDKRDTRRTIYCLDTMEPPKEEPQSIVIMACKEEGCVMPVTEGLDVCDDHIPIVTD